MGNKELIQSYLPYKNRSMNKPNPKTNYRVGVDCPREPITIPAIDGEAVIVLKKHAAPNLPLGLDCRENEDGTGLQIDVRGWARGDSENQHEYEITIVIDPTTHANHAGNTYYLAYNFDGTRPDDKWNQALGEMALDHEGRIAESESAIAQLQEDIVNVGGGSGVAISLILIPAEGSTDVSPGFTQQIKVNKWYDVESEVIGLVDYYPTALDRTNNVNAIVTTKQRASEKLLTIKPNVKPNYGTVLYGRMKTGQAFVDGSGLGQVKDWQVTIEAIGQVSQGDISAVGTTTNLTVGLDAAHKGDNSLTYNIAQGNVSNIIAANVSWAEIDANNGTNGKQIVGTFTDGDDIFIQARQGANIGTWSLAVDAIIYVAPPNEAPTATITVTNPSVTQITVQGLITGIAS